MVEADVAFAIRPLAALRVGGGDPEQRLAVAPAGHVLVVVLTLEAEKAEQLVIEFLRAREIADAQHEMIDADDARHGGSDPGIRLRSILNELRRGGLRPGSSSGEKPPRNGAFAG